MILSSDRRLCVREAVTGIRGVNSSGFASAAGSGPAGSATMTFFTLLRMHQTPVSNSVPFGRTNSGTTIGWCFVGTATTLRARIRNGGGVTIDSPTVAVTGRDVDNLFLLVAALAADNLTLAVNGVSAGATATGGGYTAPGGTEATVVGGATGFFFPADDYNVLDCGLLNGYDATATIASLSQQWMEDVQQGRDLTWPRAPVANSDWYWNPRDAIVGGAARANWIDRYSAVALARSGNVQGSSVPTLFPSP